MTRLERNRQKFFQSKLMETEGVHYPDGKRQYDGPSYEGTVYACACGQWFVDLNDLAEHIEREAAKCEPS